VRYKHRFLFVFKPWKIIPLRHLKIDLKAWFGILNY
jgi:hypothetical protein